MVYAYDRNIQMPTKDLYNTQMMAMAINAAKEEYNNAQKRIDDFYDKYGDFYSPFIKDQNWYQQNVIDKVNNKINDIYRRGGDPLRNAQDSAEVTQVIRQLPIGIISEMKRNAKVGELYQQNAAKLAQENKYNSQMSAWEDGDFSDFSTVGENGQLNTWGKQSPSAYQDIDQLLEPIVKNVKPMYDEARTKADKNGRIWKTVSLPRLMSQFNDSMSDILSTPSGRYLLAQSQREADIINASRPGSNITAMDILKNKAANRLKDHVQEEFAYDPVYMENLKHRHALSIANTKNNPTPSTALEYTTRIGSTINNRFNQNMRSAVSDYLKDKIQKLEKRESRKTSEHYSPNPNYKGSKYYKNLLNNLSNPNSIKSLQDAGLVDEYGNVSGDVVRHAKNIYAAQKAGDKYWDSRSYTPSSSWERQMYKNMLAGSDEQEKVFGSEHNTIVSGPQTGVTYAPYRYASSVNGTKYLSPKEELFASWFSKKRIYGYTENGVVRMAQIPQNGINFTDFDGRMFIHDEDFDDFISKIENNSAVSKSQKKEDLAKELGLIKRVDNTYETPEIYWSVPIVRSYDIVPDDMNQQYNKNVYGSNNASGERMEAIEAALNYYNK